jgi:membrane protease YdiL (CAAX protease family)
VNEPKPINEQEPGTGQPPVPLFEKADGEPCDPPQANEARLEVEETTSCPLEESAKPPSPMLVEPSHSGELPGPGILAAIGWLIALLIVQGLFSIPALAAGLTKGLFPLALMVLSGFLAAWVIVLLKYGRDSRRALALRAPDWRHVGCLVVLLPPLTIVKVGTASWLETAYLTAGVFESQLAPPPAYEAFAEGVGERTAPLAVVIIIVFAAVLPAVWEELYLRGFLGRGLVARWGVVPGIALTSILFGALHFHPIQSVLTAISGIVLHVVYLWSRSLFAPILLHAANNSLAFLIGFVVDNNSPPTEGLGNDLIPWPLILGDELTPWPLILAALVTVAAVGWIFYSVRVRWFLPNGSIWTPGYVTAEMPPAELGARLLRQRAGKWPFIVTGAAYLLFISVIVWEVLQ